MTYDSTVLSHAPLFYLPMTEVAGGTTLADATGNGHTGTRNAFAPPLPIIGGVDGAITGDVAVVMPGRDSEIDFAAGSGCPATPAFTLDYWVQWADPANLDNDLDFLYDGTFPNRLRASLNNLSATDLEFVMSVNGIQILDHVFTLPHPACWHYYAYTYDGTDAKIYLDGALIYTNSDPGIAGLIWATASGGFWANSGGVITTTDAFNLNHSAFYTTALSAGQIAAIYAAAAPRQDDACFHAPIRLRHGTGHVVFESTDVATKLRARDADVLTHDGATMRVMSGGVPKLQVPIPPAPEPPTRWVGVDPGGGLTVHDALPTPATHGLAPLVPPLPVVTTGLTCDELRCGAASNMRLHLEELYNNWATVLGGAVKLGEILGAVAAIAALGELVVGAAILGEFAEDVFAAIKPNLQAWIGTIVPNPFPAITIPGDQMIWNGAYCQLTCSGNVVDPTSAQVQAWNTYITNNSSALIGPSLQLALLNALLDFTPLLDWQTAASSAVANPGCAGFSCP